LRAFFERDEPKKFIRDRVDRYKKLWRELAAARVSLEKFERVCARRGGAGTSLPNSIRVDVSSKVSFTSVSGQPAFYAEEMRRIQELEVETTKAVHAILLSGKKRHLAHLERTAQEPHVYLESIRRSIEELVEPFFANEQPPAPAAAAAASSGPAPSSTTPLKDAAVIRITNGIQFGMYVFEMAQSARSKEAKEEEAQAKQAQLKAQEQVMNGAHDGANIASIATTAATKVVNNAFKVQARAQAAGRTTPGSLRTASPTPTSATSRPNRMVIDLSGPGSQFELDSAFLQTSSTTSPDSRTAAHTSRKRGREVRDESVDSVEISDDDAPPAASTSSRTPSHKTNPRGGAPPNTRLEAAATTTSKRQRRNPTASALAAAAGPPSPRTSATVVPTAHSDTTQATSTEENQPMEQ
jgi:hypothetical protein